MQDKRINAGYEIIKSFPVGNTGGWCFMRVTWT